MQKEQMKALLSVLVSTATFFSARCESSKSERPSVPDANIAALTAPASSTQAEVPDEALATSAAPLAPPPADVIVLAPTAPTPRFFNQPPLHVGALSIAPISPLGL